MRVHALLLGLVGLTPLARAELALPAGAVVELRLTGREQVGPAYEKSALGQILNDPKMQVFLERPKEWAVDKLQNRTTGADLDGAVKLLRQLLARPGAIGVYPGDKPGFVWVATLGNEAEETRKLVAALPKERAHSHIVGDTVVLASSQPLVESAVAALKNPPAAVNLPALAGGTGAGWLRADVPALRKLVRDQFDRADAAGRFDAAMTALGVDGVRTVEMTMSFDGPAVRMVNRLVTADEPTGLIRALTSLPPVDENALKLLPRDTAKGSVARVNLPALWDAVVAVIKSTGETEWQRFEAKRAAYEKKLQFKFRDDLIASVGDTVAYYSKSSPSPLMPGETAMVVTLKDAEKFSGYLERLAGYANERLAARPGQMRLSIQTSDVEGRKVYSLGGFPMFMPAWTVKNGRLVVAMSPVALNSAIEQFENAKSSILDNPDFLKSRQTLPAKAVAVSYEDTKQAVMGLYGMLSLVGPMLAAQAGAELPVDMNLLPPLAGIQEKLFGTVTVMTTDAQGITVNNYGPFGTNIGVGAGGGAMMMGMALPALTHMRGQAGQGDGGCAKRLEQIGLGCHMYADDHGGKFPDRLETLKGEYLSGQDALRCPSARGGADSVSYGYLQGLSARDSGKILAYDAEGNHPGGRHVLHGDGRVQWMPEQQFQEAIRKQTKAAEKGSL